MNNTEKHKCKCGHSSSMFFCPRCGAILEYPSILSNKEDLKTNLRNFVSKLVKTAHEQKVDIENLVADSAINEFAYKSLYERIAYLQKLCGYDIAYPYFGEDGSSIFDEINKFADKCSQNECQIAVAGTIKAGKSMIINALLGREIASTFPTPETASLTRFRKSLEGDYVKVSFYTTQDWTQLWDSVMESSRKSNRDDSEDFLSEYNSLNADSIKGDFLNKQDIIIKTSSIQEMKEIVDKYTSARFPEHYFAKEVEIGLSNCFLAPNVVIVDTPGLDDPVSYRTDITRLYLRKANVILICKKSSSAEIRRDELEQLISLFSELRYYKDRIYIVGTQIDIQPNMKDYWEKFTLPEYIKYLKSKVYFGSEETAMNHIIPASAWYFLNALKANTNPEVWKDKNVAKVLREMICRLYDYTPLEELIDEYGEEEARKLFKSPRQLFDSNFEDILARTGIPLLREILIDGPVKNAQKIILTDIKSQYQKLVDAIRKKSESVSGYLLETISVSNSNNIREQIANLEKRIAKEKIDAKTDEDNLNLLLKQMREATSQAVSKVKSAK